MTNHRLAAVLAERARHAAARRARHLNRRPRQDPALPHDHQLGDHPGFTPEDDE